LSLNNGDLTIADGGTVVSGSAFIGTFDPDVASNIFVSGNNSSLVSQGHFSLLHGADAQVESGGRITTNSAFLQGQLAVNQGGLFEATTADLHETLVVNGAGARFKIGQLAIYEDATVQVSDSAIAELDGADIVNGEIQVRAGGSLLGYVSADTSASFWSSRIDVGGAGSTWDSTAIDWQGERSTFNLHDAAVASSQRLKMSDSTATISSGATLFAAETEIGLFGSNSTNMTVTGTGSEFSAIVGSIGSNGILTVENGASLIADRFDQAGLVSVSGFGSSINIATDLFMTEQGTLTIEDGAIASAFTLRVFSPFAKATIASSELEAIGQIETNGTLEIVDAARVTTDSVHVGSESSLGLARVSGNGTTLTSRHLFAELGRLQIENGGQVKTLGSANVGNNQSGGGVTVDGPGSQWTIDDYLTISNGANSSEIRITNGGLIETNSVLAYGLGEPKPSVTVSGDQSRLIATNVIDINGGKLVIDHGGIVETYAAAIRGQDSSLTIGQGTLAASQVHLEGSYEAAGGTAEIIGDVTIADTATVTTRGLASTVFHGDVTSSASTIRTEANGETIFKQQFIGKGSFTGGGDVRFLASILLNTDPETSNFEGDVYLGPNSESTFAISAIEGFESDFWDISGDFYLDGDLNLNVYAGTIGEYEEFWIAETGGDVFGQFQGLGEGSLVGTFNERDLFISYSGQHNGRNGVRLFSVPEPSATMVLACLTLLVFVNRRRKQSLPC
jgi:T5SS/PEP-CTERM-associated repeat protein